MNEQLKIKSLSIFRDSIARPLATNAERPTQQASKLSRPSDGESRRETPPTIFASHTNKSGAVSRLQKLIETRSTKNFGPKSEIRFRQIVDPKDSELKWRKVDQKKNVSRLNTSTSSLVVAESGSESDVGESNPGGKFYYSTKSVPDLSDPTFDRLESTSKLIDSTNLSVSLPFKLNEVPQPCQVDEYDDFFTLDQNVLERSERRSYNTSKSNGLRYRSSIRIMVRPEASAANPDHSGGLKSVGHGQHQPRSIVKEQFR